ncbi:MAG: family 65 glycosyl hydrolase domain-containing protein [Flavobacteriales bacterium]
MKQFLEENAWSIVERGFDPARQRSCESIFSLGNGRFGQRANFEETYTGDHLQGSYVAGLYYPDKTKVGWWKNGYPEYFAKVLNSTNWIGIRVWIDGEELDLATAKVTSFLRVLNMADGYLQRSMEVELPSGKRIGVEALRFCSLSDDETAALRYTITPINFSGELVFEPYLDADVVNEDANWDERFWTMVDERNWDTGGTVVSRTKKTEYELGVSMQVQITQNGSYAPGLYEADLDSGRVALKGKVNVAQGDRVVLHKYVGVVSSLNADAPTVGERSKKAAQRAAEVGFDQMLADQANAWKELWRDADITIEGDVAAQQAIRFNIFQLYQTYTGEDDRLNIGPKGFTGEKYGGSTYWDTEAYCVPFYLNTRKPEVVRQLLVYRYKQLGKAIENAEKLGFTGGAALYPMVTMNGEECHNEWEITFEEIHRNGAIAYAILNYVRHTGDRDYLAEYGFDVLLGIARFWAQRVNWSEAKQAYVMLGVTGPNEYENNVNNNWYTNYIAAWTLRYTAEVEVILRQHYPEAYAKKVAELNFQASELEHWADVSNKMHYPQLEDTEVFLQQDGFMDKEQLKVSDLDPAQRPINQHWSWDRILRSIFIKQADTLQGFYFFEDDFTESQHKANFDFYEPRTVHESSLSPCVHAVLAAKLGMEEKAYEMYLRTARLDLDDYNHEVYQGLHITSMAGTWMAVVEGFGGLRIRDGKPHFQTMLPAQWDGFSFKILFRGRLLEVKVSREGTQVVRHEGEALEVVVNWEVRSV